MWQKCPVCNGTGKDPNPGTFNTAAPVCTVCNGEKIISQLTGKPPAKSNGDYDGQKRESQQEYFGK